MTHDGNWPQKPHIADSGVVFLEMNRLMMWGRRNEACNGSINKAGSQADPSIDTRWYQPVSVDISRFILPLPWVLFFTSSSLSSLFCFFNHHYHFHLLLLLVCFLHLFLFLLHLAKFTVLLSSSLGASPQHTRQAGNIMSSWNCICSCLTCRAPAEACGCDNGSYTSWRRLACCVEDCTLPSSVLQVWLCA